MAYLDKVGSLYNYSYNNMRSSTSNYNQAGAPQKKSEYLG